MMRDNFHPSRTSYLMRSKLLYRVVLECQHIWLHHTSASTLLNPRILLRALNTFFFLQDIIAAENKAKSRMERGKKKRIRTLLSQFRCFCQVFSWFSCLSPFYGQDLSMVQQMARINNNRFLHRSCLNASAGHVSCNCGERRWPFVRSQWTCHRWYQDLVDSVLQFSSFQFLIRVTSDVGLKDKKSGMHTQGNGKVPFKVSHLLGWIISLAPS